MTAALSTQPVQPQASPPAATRPGPAGTVLEWAFGAVGLLALLAGAAAIPVLQFATLGWLLRAEGRVARTGSLRGSLPGLRPASRVGSALIGLGLLALPALLLQDFHRAALLVDPQGPAAATLGWVWPAVGAALLLHGALALAAGGGRLRAFFRPLRNAAWAIDRLAAGANLRDAGRAVAARLRPLELAQLVVLGLQGFTVGVAWLLLPSLLLILGPKAPPLGLLGGLLLIAVAPLAVAAQARLAATGSLREAFAVRRLRAGIHRAPYAHLVALVLTLGPAIPLYSLKVEPPARDLLWLPAAAFLVALLPGRLAAGWAHARGQREGKAAWPHRLAGLALRSAAVLGYAIVVFMTQFFAWRGDVAALAQHAFLLPVASY